ncbi:glutamine amidotransferase subunit pdxT [Waddlia chondrophila 2032/99]|uniref:Pyridoxal 5'-phosphate synthase subunit PdxT n=2 Tax=Waddlia chondrophila TaxID=71667 RepID=D6YSK0_WADCW|nr:pyridoxal 5'-phosphate synthase glutaminase subunit PdxT [Waddlia chondrophila]ADI39045.1 Glutamine amidotransferase [Waddlia chondrophila WSU 86-1044]CCB92157.1 glutamine amidotransferase subunit pdxT [Waddlia chondrophila 2032/99]
MIGILALQGAFEKHAEMLEKLGEAVRFVKRPSDLNGCSGLVIPGGESTTMRIHLKRMEMIPALKRFAEGSPIFGTCAGLILMANELDILDVEIKRNGYGPQVYSFSQPLDSDLFSAFQGVFIRAPRIQSIGNEVDVLASCGEEPVLVRQGRHLGATFHPELTEDSRIHQEFLSRKKIH